LPASAKWSIWVRVPHVKNNQEVRRLLVNRGIVPERLPAAEDVKKVEHRLAAEQKKLPKEVKRLEEPDSGRAQGAL
jgi:DNA-damage-inducible protein D